MSETTKNIRRPLPVIIRQYSPVDKEAIHKINQESLEISFRYYFDLFHAKEPELFLVAEYQDKIIGFIMVKNGINPHLSRYPSGLIYAIAVASSYRSLGVGTQLVNAICEVLKKRQVLKFFLHVRCANHRAIKFYERLGFHVLKKIEKFYSWGEDAYRMQKIFEY